MQVALLTLCLSLLMSLAPAQNAGLINPLGFIEYNEPAGPPPFQTLTAIHYNGRALVKNDPGNRPLTIAPQKGEVFGHITVQTWSQEATQCQSAERVGFRVAIQDYATKTLWMYSPETLYELDLLKVRDRCHPEDLILIMVVDKQYRLPRYQVKMLDGC